MILKNHDVEADAVFNKKIRRSICSYYILIFFIIILFFIYPLISLPLIGLLSPFVNNKLRGVFSLLSIVFFILFYSSITPFSDIAEYVLIYRNIMETNIFSFGRFGGGIEIFILLMMRVVYFIFNGNEYVFYFQVSL